MKILLRVFNAAHGIEAAFVDVTPEYSKWLLRLRGLWRALERTEALKEMNPQYSLNFSLFEYGAEYFGCTKGNWETAAVDVEYAEVLELIYPGEDSLLESVRAVVVEREKSWSAQDTEADRIIVDDIGARWTARPKYSDDLMETATLRWELIEAAAQQEGE